MPQRLAGHKGDEKKQESKPAPQQHVEQHATPQPAAPAGGSLLDKIKADVNNTKAQEKANGTSESKLASDLLEAVTAAQSMLDKPSIKKAVLDLFGNLSAVYTAENASERVAAGTPQEQAVAQEALRTARYNYEHSFMTAFGGENSTKIHSPEVKATMVKVINTLADAGITAADKDMGRDIQIVEQKLGLKPDKKGHVR